MPVWISVIVFQIPQKKIFVRFLEFFVQQNMGIVSGFNAHLLIRGSILCWCWFLELRKNKPTFHSVRLDLQVLFMIFTLHIWLFLDMHQINFCNIEEKSSENKWNRRFSLTSRAGPRFFVIRASDGCLLKMN
jgi:hypothetical protein